jgi:hypothetical protein
LICSVSSPSVIDFLILRIAKPINPAEMIWRPPTENLVITTQS